MSQTWYKNVTNFAVKKIGVFSFHSTFERQNSNFKFWRYERKIYMFEKVRPVMFGRYDGCVFGVCTDTGRRRTDRQQPERNRNPLPQRIGCLFRQLHRRNRYCRRHDSCRHRFDNQVQAQDSRKKPFHLQSDKWTVQAWKEVGRRTDKKQSINRHSKIEINNDYRNAIRYTNGSKNRHKTDDY